MHFFDTTRNRGKRILYRYPVFLFSALCCVIIILSQGSVSLAASTSSPLSHSPRNSASWPMFGYDPQHSGYNPNETILSTKNVSGLAPAWINFTYPDDSFDTSPVVVNGVVYTCTTYGLLFAYAVKTGQPLWRYDHGGLDNSSSPAVTNGIIYVGSDTLYALNAQSGKQLWTFKAGSFISSPVVINGVLYFGTYNSYLYALNATTGTLLWSYHSQGSNFGSPAVDNSMVYVTNDSSTIALNAQTGTEQWTFNVGASTPTVVNGTVYIAGTDNNLYALNAITGKVLWKKAVSGSAYEGVAVASGALYVGTDHSNVDAFNALTGNSIWTFKAKSIIETAPSVANGVVYIGDLSNDLYALNAKMGKLLWSYDVIGGSTSSTMVVVNGSIFVSESDKGFYAFRLPL
jgi:outer membrane protein assembly factor BamB